MKTICLTLLLAAPAATPALDQLRTDINPALLYYQAFLVAPEPLSTRDDDYIHSREAGDRLPQRFDPIVAGYDNQFAFVRQAAASTVHCDWGIDFSHGPATLLPHLAKCKAIAQATQLRVRWNLEQGRQAEACQELLAGFALARNCAQDGPLISVLVQIASEAIHCATIAANFGRFSPESLQQLVAGLDTMPGEVTVASAIPDEKASFYDWTIKKIVEAQQENPGDEAKIIAAVHKLFAAMDSPESGQTDLWPSIVHASGGTSEGMLSLLRQKQDLFQKLTVLLALPKAQFDEQIKPFEAEIRSSPNPFISKTFPAIEKARLREFRIQVWLGMIRAAIEYKLHGIEAFRTIPDPCGNGPFEFKRFVFEGVDRGFELKSAYTGSGFPEVMIFVEKDGPGFRVDGPHVGESLPAAPAQK